MSEQNNWKDEFDKKYNGEWALRGYLTRHDFPVDNAIKYFISKLLSSKTYELKEQIRNEERQRIMNRLLEMSKNTQSVELLQAFEQLEGEHLSAIESIEI